MPNTQTVEQPADSRADNESDVIVEDDLQLLTIAEVADRLRLKPWSVYQLCDSGALRSVYIGPKGRRVRPVDLRAYIDALPTVRPTSA